MLNLGVCRRMYNIPIADDDEDDDAPAICPLSVYSLFFNLLLPFVDDDEDDDDESLSLSLSLDDEILLPFFPCLSLSLEFDELFEDDKFLGWFELVPAPEDKLPSAVFVILKLIPDVEGDVPTLLAVETIGPAGVADI